MSPRAALPRRAVLLAGFSAALVFRILYLAAQRENYDLHSFQIVAEIVNRGGDVYAGTSRYNYAPVWAYFLAAIGRVGNLLDVSLAHAVSVFLLAVDGISAFLICRILRRRNVSAFRAALAALVFFANPVSVFVSSYRAMFDNVSILFLLIAAGAMSASPARPGRAVFGVTASILVKHFTWFHPLLLWRRHPPRVSLPACLTPYVVFFATLLPFWSSRDRIRDQVFQYQGLGEPYGTERLRFLPFMPRWGTTALCVLAALACVVWIRRRDIAFDRACLLLLLVLLLFVPGIAPYYFVWPIAFGALYPSAGYAVYTAVVTLFLIHSPDAIGVELAHLPGWSGPWWALAFWLLWEMRRLSRAEVAAV